VQRAKLRKNYKFLPDIATADLAYEAFGKNPSELFENAGIALESVMVDLTTITAQSIKEINIKRNSLGNLLTSFLEELVFLKDTEQILFSTILCDVNKQGKSWTLNCKLGGEKIDRQKHKLGVDVKAVTKHLFKIEKLPSKILHCQVVLDV